ncbi:MAG: sodium/proline symporter [Pseudomonadales bacterium]
MFLGGRNLGPLVASISYSASSSSAWTILGVSGYAYFAGFSAIWLLVGSLVGHGASWFWLSESVRMRSRAEGSITMTEFITHDCEKRHKKLATYVATGIIVFLFILYVASQLQGAGNAFNSAFNLPPFQSIVIGGAVVLVYTLLGGFWAVSLTDTVQGLLMFAAAVFLPVFAITAIGGCAEFYTQTLREFSEDQSSLSFTFDGISALTFVVGLVSVGFGVFGQPHLITRFMATRDTAAIRRAKAYTVIWFSIVYGGMILIGWSGRILLPEIASNETVFFDLVNFLCHPIVAGILVAAVLSAVMSTADSQLLVVASTFAHDLDWESRVSSAMLMARIIIVVVTVAAIVIALALPATIFERVLLAWNALGGAFGPLVILRAMGVRLRSESVVTAMLLGFSVALVFNLFIDTPGDVGERMLPFVCSLFYLLFWGRASAVKSIA